MASARSLTGDCGCCNDNGAKYGSHRFSGTAVAADAGVSFVQMLACEKASNTSPPPVDPYPFATVAFFNTESCPSGWEKAVGKALGYLAQWTDNNGYTATLYFDGKDTDGDGVIQCS